MKGHILNRKKIHKPELADDTMFYPDHGRVLPRKSVLWGAHITVKGHEFSCQIRNLSFGGLKIKLDIPLKGDVVCKVAIPKYQLEFDAKIAWQSEGFFGLKFIDDHELIREQFSEGAAIVGVDAIRFLEALE